jgi:polygalacturonase
MLNSFSKVILITLFLHSSQLMAQIQVIKNIRSFGATSNGKTNDTEAFLKAAAFFNERGGNGTLLIPKGTYIVGKQIKGTADIHTNAFGAVDILAFNHVQNLLIKGEAGSVLKYEDNLKFGCFDPVTGAVYNGFDAATTANYVAVIGNCISLTNCQDITIKMLALDGNNKK